MVLELTLQELFQVGIYLLLLEQLLLLNIGTEALGLKQEILTQLDLELEELELIQQDLLVEVQQVILKHLMVLLGLKLLT